MAVANPPPLVPIAGARDREGRFRRNRRHWIAPSRGIIPIFLFLIIAAPLGFNIVPFHCLFWKSTVRQCKTDPGRRRERSGACARAAPMGQGVGRVWRPPASRLERARPFSGEFWRFGPDKGTSIDFGQATRAAGAALARRRQKSGRGRYCGARHTPHPPFLTHARSLATHRCGVDGGTRDRWVAGAAERGVSVGCVRRDGDGAGGGSSDAGRALEGDDGVEQWSSTAACNMHGAGPRCRRVRYCPLGCESEPECARAC